MTIPTINLNGTSKAALLDALEKASEALEAAYQALKETAPNGRDYYVRGPGAFTSAAVEHGKRLASVDAVKCEIDKIIDAVAAQG